MSGSKHAAQDDKKPDNKHVKQQEDRLDEELKETFPSSDPPSITQPGAGTTGAEEAPDKKD